MDYMKRNNKLIILDGVSGAGKSCLLSLARGDENYTIIKRSTTRPCRGTDETWEFDFCDQIVQKPGIVMYSALGKTYGIDFAPYIRQNSDKVYLLICTDLQAINQLRKHFFVKHIYVFRHNTPEELESILRNRGTDSNQFDARMEEFYSAKDEYIVRLSSIDAVILNLFDEDYLFQQLDAIRERFQNTDII